MNNNNLLGMRERKGWTAAEDQVLRLLKDQRGEIKWSAIARMMQLQFGMAGKSGKQCRERYHNHLKPAISHAGWQPHEDALLLQLHRQCGNKWSAIALSIPGRTENCVKNHFYSKLRKVVRRLTRTAAGPSGTHPSTPSLALLSRIVAASECRFRPGSRVSEQWVCFAADLVEKLYNYQSIAPQDSRNAEMEILADMAYFDLNFKKRRCSKRDVAEADYRQRRAAPAKKKDTFGTVAGGGLEGTHPIIADSVKIEGYSLPEIFPVKTSSSTTTSDPVPKRSVQEGEVRIEHQQETPYRVVGLGAGEELQLLGLGEGVVLKAMPCTFMSFCELEEWDKVHMLEESEEYAYHYNPLHQ